MRVILILIMGFLALMTRAQVFLYTVDLGAVKEDKLFVRLSVQETFPDTVLFRMPQIVPGTYAIYNFGRFLSDFHAFSADGTELKVARTDTNSWRIIGAKALRNVSYWVEDTWDTPQKENPVFEPAGTSFDAGKYFMLNQQGLFGYIEGFKFREYRLAIKHPEKFYGATGISTIRSTAEADTFFLRNYDELIDSPILYALPDTATIRVGKTTVLVAVRSPNQMINATQIAGEIKGLLMAQREYLGGELPVDKYAFLFCFATEGEGNSGASGALEHCFSSAYFLPEMDLASLKQMLRDVTAHEFFHIITPLTIHSEEIGDFGFNDPKMSQHLWLYEGCTEYAASHVQVRSGMMSFEEFLDKIREKMLGASGFRDDLPFTEMSRDVLTKYQKEYANVYQKGALIGMCLDILLLHHSDGKYSLRDLMRDLGKRYGQHISFKDDDLFRVITELSYPEIGAFLKKYIAGKEPLPYKEVLDLAGVYYLPGISVKTFSYGGFSIGFNTSSGRLVAVNTSEMDEFGKEIGLTEGDELITFNGTALTLNNVKDVLTGFMSHAKEGKKLKVVVERMVDGKAKRIRLKARVRKIEVTESHLLSANDDPSPSQLRIRKAWTGSPK